MREIAIRCVLRVQRTSSAVAVVAALTLAGCSGGRATSSSIPSGPPPPPALTISYPLSLDLAFNSPMVPVTPKVTGSLRSFSVSPALPPGLLLDPYSGVISGTPANVSALNQYTVTGKGSSDSTTAKLWISVHDSAPVVMYESPVYSITANVPASMGPRNPAPGGGTALSWGINPAPPPGLLFDSTTGQISGTATTPIAPMAYKVTATNQVGTSSGTLTMGVYPNTPLLDLSLEGAVDTLRFDGTRVLAANSNQWVLKDYTNARTLAHGNAACLTTASPPCGEPTAQMTGGFVLVDELGGFDVRSATDGHVLWTQSAQPIYWVRLAMDASYVVAGTRSGLIIWSIDGSTSITVAGDYSQAIVAARPGFVLVANGPAGADVIEQVSVSTGAATDGPPYTGVFQSWFQDGSAFVSSNGTTLYVIAYDGVLLDTVPTIEPTELGGLGQWFWTFSPSTGLNIYKLGSSSTPVYANPTLYPPYVAFASGNAIAMLLLQNGTSTPAHPTLVDLSTGSAVVTTEPIPSQFGAYAWTAAVISTSSWVLGSVNGLIYDGVSPAGNPRFLSHGDTLSIAGGGNNFSVATADGNVYSFDGSTYSLTSTVVVPTDYMTMSRDGSALAVRTSNPSGDNVTVYSPLTGALLYQMKMLGPARQLLMSTSGTLLTVDFGYASPPNACNAMIISIPDGTTTLCYKNLPAGTTRVFNPDAPLAAVNGSVYDYTVPKYPTSRSTYDLYSDDVYLSSGAGWVAPGWLDQWHFVTAYYQDNGFGLVYLGPDSVVDSSGKVYSTYTRDLFGTAVADAESLSEGDQVFSAYSGDVSWMTGNTTSGWVVGNFYVFKYDGQLLAQPWH
jgi:hypothetical protein